MAKRVSYQLLVPLPCKGNHSCLVSPCSHPPRLEETTWGEGPCIFLESWVCLRIELTPHCPNNKNGSEGLHRGADYMEGQGRADCSNPQPKPPFRTEVSVEFRSTSSHPAFQNKERERLERSKRGAHPARQQFPSGPPRLLRSR